MRFLNHMTFGQYVPAPSLVHALDPRCKILAVVLLMTGLFLVENLAGFLFWGVLLFFLGKSALLPFSLVLRGARPVLILVAFTGIIHIFFTDGTPLWSWGVLHVSEEGLVMAFKMGFRLLLLVMFAGLLTLTTSPMQLSDGLERLFSPLSRFGFPTHEMAMMMTIALRFIPTLLDETDRIFKAQLARGADLDQGGLVRRIKAFVPVLVPLFIIVFDRAEELAVAMEARCYNGGAGRTRMFPLHWSWRETAVLAALLGVVVLLLFFDQRGFVW